MTTSLMLLVQIPAIGTDFDGFTDPPDEIIHMGQLPRITSHLKAVGGMITQLRSSSEETQ